MLLLISTIAQIAGQLLLKRASQSLSLDFSRPLATSAALVTSFSVWSWFVFAVLSTVLWMRVLRDVNINIAFPVSQSLAYLMLIFAAQYYFDEHLNRTQVLGLIVILAGIALSAIPNSSPISR
ncbi:MAG: hypothetical protein WC969_02985 [Elusimicrobiota bacterium]